MLSQKTSRSLGWVAAKGIQVVLRLWTWQAGRVCSMICQVHTNIFVPVQTVPILDAFRLRGGSRERAVRPARGRCGDWPSQISRLRLGQSPTLPSSSRTAVPGRTMCWSAP